MIASRPRPKRHQHDRITTQLHTTEHDLARLRETIAQREAWLANHGRGLAGLTHRAAVKATRADLATLSWREQTLSQCVEQLTGQEAELRRHEQQRTAWIETHERDLDRNHAILTELAWRSHARATAHTIDPPDWLTTLLGPTPDTSRARRTWRTAAEQVAGYRDRFQITEDGLGERPHDLTQLREWRDCRQLVDRVAERSRGRSNHARDVGHARSM